jgi:hypothetical protein
MNKLTPRQEKQLAFCDRMELVESLAYLPNYDVSCKTCGEHITFHAVDSVRYFIRRHTGHETWLIYLGKPKEI